VTTVETIVSVPDGGTLLMGGQTLAGETQRENGTPVLSKIPFLKRLFTNQSMAKDEQVILLLVKPTILIQREQEDKAFPLLSNQASGD
jgi:general secretion pathway protein D